MRPPKGLQQQGREDWELVQAPPGGDSAEPFGSVLKCKVRGWTGSEQLFLETEGKEAAQRGPAVSEETKPTSLLAREARSSPGPEL